MDERIINLCRKWDEFIGFNNCEDISFDELKAKITTCVAKKEIIDTNVIDHWNKKIILTKDKSFNGDLSFMYNAIRYGKTESFYTKMYGKFDCSQFENLIQDFCEKLLKR